MRFAIFGTGFWSRFQLAAWQELEGVECVALYNRTKSKADVLAEEFGVPAVYDDPEKLLSNEHIDFIDIITAVETHADFVKRAASQQIPVICQKPMATSLQEAQDMVVHCHNAAVEFYIHENWRWQRPIRQLRDVLLSETIGKPFRAHIYYGNSFPVVDNQPFLKRLEKFIISDMGSHILDVARFLFGEADSLYCQTESVHKDIKGEDVASLMMKMGDTVVLCEISYASRIKQNRFPEVFIRIEGERGAVELGPDYWIHVTTEDGTSGERYPPPHYAWADPAYDLIHASIVECNRDLLKALQGRGNAETTGDDNLKTVKLVFAAYDSAARGCVIDLTKY